MPKPITRNTDEQLTTISYCGGNAHFLVRLGNSEKSEGVTRESSLRPAGPSVTRLAVPLSPAHLLLLGHSFTHQLIHR